jgi:glycosyltransferase involved in cell wall biosynthesis
MEGLRKSVVITVSNDLVTDQRMFRVATRLVNLGYNVELIGRQLPESLSLNKAQFTQTRQTLRWRRGPLFYLELNIRIILKLWRSNYDIHYAVDADTALAGIILKRLKSIKLIYDAHELFPEVPELVNKPFVKRVWSWLDERIIKKADVRITVSESIANYYKSRYGKDFLVIRNLPDTAVEQDKTVFDGPFVLYQGALNTGRGLECLIEAAKSLKPMVVIAGEGDLSTTLRDRVLQLNLAEKVIFTGKLHPENLKSLTSKAWLGYNLLENTGLSYYYSLSNKTFDYIQAGVPQLMVEFPEYVALNQLYNIGVFCELSINAIVKTINDLAENPELYNTMKQNCVEASKQLTWEQECTVLDTAFKGL